MGCLSALQAVALLSLLLLPLPTADSAYPACSSDSDCFNQTLYRCVGCRYNASEPAGVCYGTSGKATCQCSEYTSSPAGDCRRCL